MIGHRDAADVVRLGTVGRGVAPRQRLIQVSLWVGAVGGDVITVDTAEHQGAVAKFEVSQPGGDAIPDHVALVAGLERAAGFVHHGVAHLFGGPAGGVQALVGEVDVGLLGLQLRVSAHENGDSSDGRIRPTIATGPN